MTDEVCPADIDDSIAEKMQSIALKVHNILRLGFYSRIDFMLDKNNEPYCLEANTLPGMTSYKPAPAGS